MPTAFTAKSLDEMSYKNLQALAKDNKIRANQKADQIRKENPKNLRKENTRNVSKIKY